MRVTCAIVAGTIAAVAAIAAKPTTSVTVASLSAAAQQTPAVRDNVAPRAGTAVIRGRVIAADTGRPLARAQVTLTPAARMPANAVPVVAADDQGRYEFRSLSAGSLTLQASKAGYLTLAHGQRRPLEAARALAVADGQVLEDIDFALPRGGTIVARVVDELGDPMAGVGITLYRRGFAQGERALSQVRMGSGIQVVGSATPGGEQRFYGLPPGDYYVAGAVTGGPGGVAADGGRGYLTTFYPGTVSEQDAQPVKAELGQDRTVTIRMIATRLTRITGTLKTSDGRPIARATASLEYRRPGVTATYPVGNRVDGTLTANSVPPGEYFFTVAPVAGGDTEEVAWMPITVTDRDLTGVNVVTTRGATVRGRFVFDTGTPTGDTRPTGTVQASVVFGPPGAGVAAYSARTFNPDWTFELRGILGTGGFIRPSVAAGAATPASRWFVKAIMLDGRDVIDTPLDFVPGRDVNDVQIILTQKRAQVTGTATDDKGAKSTDYVAVLFPEDRTQWTGLSRSIAQGRSDQAGRFGIYGLPPGKYLAAAIDYLEMGEERDPDLLKRLVDGAVPITLGDGEAKTVNLKVMVY